VVFFVFLFKKHHTVEQVPKSNRKTKNTIVGTVPKSNRKTKNTTLSERFQNLIEKQKKYHTVGTVPKSNRKIKNTTLSEQFDSVVFFVFLLDFGTVPTVWCFLFSY
jgi:hypothetical protein